MAAGIRAGTVTGLARDALRLESVAMADVAPSRRSGPPLIEAVFPDERANGRDGCGAVIRSSGLNDADAELSGDRRA